MNVLEIDQLRKNMPKLKLDIARLEVAEGEFAVLLGDEGSGTSALFKLLLNMLFPDFGAIRIFGLDSRRDSEAIKQQLGMVARRPGLLYHASLRQLKAMMRPFYQQWDEGVYQNYLRQFGLNENQLYGRVGNEVKKQFVLALALAHRPRLLLLDEPFAHVAAAARENIAQALWQEQRERGMSVLLATAVPEEAARLAETLHILHQGSLLLSLPMTQLPEFVAELDWQTREKRSKDVQTARKIAQTEALFAHYTREGGEQA